jgi:hypothetical protein
MTDAQIDLKQLAQEAAQSAYSPRAQTCWFPWSHRWTMWKPRQVYSDGATSDFYRRRCVRCGRPQERFAW